MGHSRTHLRRSLIRNYLALFLDRRLGIIFVLGFASGFPWALIGSTLTAWLFDAGLTRTAIGALGSITMLYALNFLWAPLLDRVRLPALGLLGQRRAWILLMQALLLLATLLLSLTNPAVSVFWIAAAGLLLASASSTQDVAIDAYRIEIIGPGEPHRLTAASAMTTAGWWTGFGLPGGLALVLADLPGWEWSHVYQTLALILLGLILFTLWIPEPESNRDAEQRKDETRMREALGPTPAGRRTAWLLVTVVQPFAEFIRRNGLSLALAILGFIVLFKIGEAFMGRMAIVFYREIGFSNTDIGMVSKFMGWGTMLVFTLLGGLLNVRFGIFRGLLIGGIAMASTNLLFALLALTGPQMWLFVFAVVADNFTTALSTVTFVAFISYLTSRVYTASQYALMASLGNLSRTTLAAGSGMMVDGLGGNWALFFILTTIMVLPSLILLLWIRQALTERLGAVFGRARAAARQQSP
ncbi:MFS transporter [Methylonatrum kenyense]|uniref:AmpG family muropeptide MFS transporter n=1 Tax=Methylonatrum kenyense TaxID=455253 RepID=UPI0020C1832A|nr:MFS transporter [Methylonatrum kenyense]